MYFRQKRSDTKRKLGTQEMRTTVLELGLLFSVPETAPEPEGWKECLVIHNKPLPNTPFEMTFGQPLRMGAGCQGNQLGGEGWNFQSHPWPLGRTEGLEIESVTNGQWLNHSHLCDEASVKPRRMGFVEIPGWRTDGDVRKVVPTEHVNCTLSLYRVPCISSIWLFLSYILYNKAVIQ